jgi:hypothetical protein
VYGLKTVIRIMKARMMRLAGHVARMGEKRNTRGKEVIRKTKT